MQKRLLINIGNTHSSFASYDNGEFTNCLKMDSSTLLYSTEAPINFNDFESIWAASVVSEMVDKLNQFASNINWVSVDMKSKLKFDNYDPTTLGADRFANAVAAIETYQRAVMVIDCGTAITTELIDADKQFLGGVILPGRLMSYNALNQNTSLLPKVEDDNQLAKVIAKNTADAIKAGVQHATIGALKQIISETKSELDDILHIIITGGDKGFFSRELNIPAADEFFTFKGINQLAEMNEKT